MEIETTVAGIPCRARLTHYRHQAPQGPQAASDVDCYGYTECEFLLFDRSGHLALWLERKLTDTDKERIIEEFQAAMDSAASAYD